ncbi:MAG: Hsp20/alpha crystallin family protein [Acidobacteriota bacterium]
MKVFGPFVEMARLQNEVNKIFESFLEVSPEESVKAASGWTPGSDVIQTGDDIVVMVDLPGVGPDNVQLAVGRGQLIVSGEKPRAATVDGARYQCLERGHGRFSRTILLPQPVNTHHAKAILREGLLTVTFPRVANRRGEAIPIPIETE